MKTFLILLGGASIVYGGYLWTKKRKMQAAGAAGAMATAPSSAAAITSGPTIQSTASGVDNNISPVEHYSTALTFPPMTYIEVQGVGNLDGIDTRNSHSIAAF